MITQRTFDAISGPKAAELANITYRQLDYWARQGWVKPSVEAGVGRPGRRIYAPEDVVKLAALGHFGRSGADVGQLGEVIAGLDLSGPPADYLLVASGTGVEMVAAMDLRARVSEPGSTVVFDPAAVLGRMNQGRAGAGPAARKSA
ncbi:MAG TPA: MerR family transcriptional regulator [Actinomycetota bacterium]|nr:MerR family transcriptional regulator [Actinomycetota bacterium]